MQKGKIAVLIEDHFDGTEYAKYNDMLPIHGYQVEYISHLWDQQELTFGSNPEDGKIQYQAKVNVEINEVSPDDYQGILLIGGYAMDRLRYQAELSQGAKNHAPAVEFIRRALATPGLKVGTICHSLWLLCADQALLKNRKVTCAHNIVCDVENAGGLVQYQGDGTAEIVIDGDLISAKHPQVTDLLVETFVSEIAKQAQ